MSSDVQLRRHQTQAVRQPTVTQRLSEILRRRRLRIGSRSASASGHTASSISDSLTLSESNTHSAAHRNVRWERGGADIVSLYLSEIMTAIRGAAPAACSVTAAPSPSRAASRAWASGRPRAARARWQRWPPCPRCPAPAPAQDTKGREVRERDMQCLDLSDMICVPTCWHQSEFPSSIIAPSEHSHWPGLREHDLNWELVSGLSGWIFDL